MKTATPARKLNGPKNSRWGQKLTPAQVKKANTILEDLNQFWGDRDTGSADFLIKLRRGEA